MKDGFSPSSSWIWLLDRHFQESDRRVFFRKVFDLSDIPDTAVCKISADSRYMLWINGFFVHYGPVRSGYNGSWPCDIIDVAGYLRQGKNVIAVRVVHLAENIFCQPSAVNGGLLLEIPELGIFSDTGFRALGPEGFRRRGNKMSYQYTYQEDVDLAGIPADWKSPDFDDSDWFAPDFQRVADAEPYGTLIPRDIPLFPGDLITPAEGLRTCWQGDAAPQEEPVTLYCRENPDWHQPDADGNTEAVVFDFGFVRLGTVLLEYQGASGGETVDLLYCEGAIDQVPFLLSPASAGGVATASRIKVVSGNGSYELDMPVGVRYVTAVIRNRSAEMKVGVKLRDLSYPWKITGRFHSSETLLNDIHLAAERTQKSCSADTYMDCPWREQVQWWGDARIQTLNTFALTADARLLRRGIRMIGETETVSGLTRAFAPAQPWHTVIPDFSLVWVQTVYDDYFQSGETGLFREFAPRIARVLNYFAGRRDERGVFLADRRYWNFYDWGFSAGDETFPVLGNMLFLNTLEKCAVLEELSGVKLDIDHFIAPALREFLKDFFLTAAGRKALGEPRNAAYAVLDDLLDEENTGYARHVLLEELRAENPVGASPYFIHYLFEAVKKLQMDTEVIDCIRRRWGYWLSIGITTTPESWATGKNLGRTSLCHAWSAHVLAHFRDILLGVRQISANWREINFAPVYAGVEKLSGVVPTPHGDIKVEIDHKSGRQDIQLPPGIICRKG